MVLRRGGCGGARINSFHAHLEVSDRCHMPHANFIERRMPPLSRWDTGYLIGAYKRITEKKMETTMIIPPLHPKPYTLNPSFSGPHELQHC